MNAFNDNKNSFLSSIQSVKTDFHSFIVSAVPKSTKTSKQQKKSLINSLSNTIDMIDTNDFGIRIVILRTKD
jgi:hypothetical protein